MPRIEFPYLEEESKIFGKIKRPRISMDIFSKLKNEWIAVDQILADTGADLTVLPRFIGEMLVDDITTGKYVEIKGIQPSAILIAFIHRLKVKINNRKFEFPVAIADSNNVPSIFGRVEGLDLFDASFSKGEKITLFWEK